MLAVVITAVLCIGADQLTKYLASSALHPAGSIDVIKGVFRFTYVENRGAAFGSLSNHRTVFLILSSVLILALIAFTIIKRPKGVLLRLSLGMIIGGGIGNMIDRIALGYVVDFLDFCAFPKLWRWVFNCADVFVCVGTAMLMIYILMSDRKRSARGAFENSGGTKGGADDDEAE